MPEQNLTGYPSIDKPWLKYYSEEALNAPLPECTIYEYLYENNKNHLDDTALNYFCNKITYGKLFENIDKAAKGLSAFGLKNGDIILIASVTIPEIVYAFYACNRLGIIPNMVDPRTSAEGIREYITEVNAKAVITIDVAYAKIEKAAENTSVKKVITVSPADSLPYLKAIAFKATHHIKRIAHTKSDFSVKYREFISNGKNKIYTAEPYKKDNCSVIVHTGGTTGTPKGVMLSNDNLNAMVLQYRLLGAEFNRKQSFLDIMPPFIAYGIVCGIHMPLSLGLTNVLIPQLNPDKLANLIIKYKPAHMLGVPAHFEKMRLNPKMHNFDLSFFESAGAGGDAIPTKFEQNINLFLKEHNSKYPISKGYGMTEISSAAVACHGNINRFQSVGIPHLKTVVSVFDVNTCEELKYGETGEICFSAPTVMLGYYNQADETSKVLKKHKDGKLWLHSGDIGYMDKDGFVFINGRVKRIIIRHDGFKVFPSQIENVVSECSGVISCCAVGVDDKDYSQGKLPIVFAALKSGYDSNIAKKELVKLCQKKLPEYAQPIDFIFIDKLPLTPIGKIDYRILEKQAEELDKK